MLKRVAWQPASATWLRAWLSVRRPPASGRNLALCVGNSQPALLSWLMEQPQTPRVIYTDEHMARGILEGLARHGLY